VTKEEIEAKAKEVLPDVELEIRRVPYGFFIEFGEIVEVKLETLSKIGKAFPDFDVAAGAGLDFDGVVNERPSLYILLGNKPKD
jgi:hypothetical protein